MTVAALERYRPRRFAPEPLWEVEGHWLKVTTIALADAPAIPGRVVAAARDHVAGRLPEAAAAEGGSSGLGFVILHAGLQGTWLLMHWWAHDDICCQRLSRADPGKAAFQPADERPLMACLWELRAIEHERAAWIRTMLSGAPDAAAYLADTLPAGLH